MVQSRSCSCARTIYCNTYVYTFHVCLCLLALTFVCNSTYLLKCSFQIYQKSIVVFIRSSKVWFKTTSCAKGPELHVHVCLAYLFLHSGQVLGSFKWYFKRKYLNLIDSNCDVVYYQYTGCIKKKVIELWCAIGRSKFNIQKNSWKDQAFKSVDGSGNSRIRKFFKVETKNMANSSFQLLSLGERQKNIPFLSNKYACHQTAILWFCNPFLSISSLFKMPKTDWWKLFCKWNFLRKVEERAMQH